MLGLFVGIVMSALVKEDACIGLIAWPVGRIYWISIGYLLALFHSLMIWGL